MKTNKSLQMIAFILLVIGGINWGLVGLLDLNIVSTIFGTMPTIEKLVYILVGASAVYIAVTHKADCKTCK